MTLSTCSTQPAVSRFGSISTRSDPRCPWRNPFAERFIGNIRRECLDQVVVLNERHLRRILRNYFEHYHRGRCHRSLAMGCPRLARSKDPRTATSSRSREAGGALYRHYERRAA